MMDLFLNSLENYPNSIIIAVTILSIIFIMIGHVYREAIQAQLKNTIITVPKFDIDGWSITHFVLFMLFGFVQPGYPLTFMAVGVGWELFEDYLSADENTKLVSCSTDKGMLRNFMCNGIQDGYWYGKWDDILCNTLGYVIGSSIRTYVYPKGRRDCGNIVNLD